MVQGCGVQREIPTLDNQEPGTSDVPRHGQGEVGRFNMPGSELSNGPRQSLDIHRQVMHGLVTFFPSLSKTLPDDALELWRRMDTQSRQLQRVFFQDVSNGGAGTLSLERVSLRHKLI